MKRMLVGLAAGAVGALSGRTAPKAAVLAPASWPALTRTAAPPELGVLLAAARGAPPLLCALAARSVRDYGEYGWGGADAPAPPLGRATTDALPDDGGDGRRLTDADRGRLLDALASDDACVRELSVRLLGRRRDSSVVAPLVARLAGPNAPLRAAAAMSLGLAAPARGGAPDAVDPLARALGDASPDVRANAAWALGESGGGAATGAADALGTAAGGDRSARVRGSAAWALGQLGRRAAPAGLLRAVRDADADVRLKAAWALGQLGDVAAQPAVQEALAREIDPNARRALVRALVASGGRSEQALAGLLGSGDPQVREAAVRGLVGRDAFGPWPWPWPRPRPFP